MLNSSYVTNHARKRIHERMGVRKKTSERVANIALKKGLKLSDTKGKLKKYINKLFSDHGVGDNIRIYAEKVFIFQGSCLITVLSLPNEFKNLANICRTEKPANKKSSINFRME